MFKYPLLRYSDLEILGLEVTTMLKCEDYHQRWMQRPQFMWQKWNEFDVPAECSSTHFWGIVTLNSLIWRSRLCWNVKNVIRDESTAITSCHKSEMNLLYQAKCSSTHFWGTGILKSLVWRSQLCGNIDSVIRNGSTALNLYNKSEMNSLYQAECLSTHFWGIVTLKSLILKDTRMWKCGKC